jgi:hypothetical protein
MAHGKNFGGVFLASFEVPDLIPGSDLSEKGWLQLYKKKRPLLVPYCTQVVPCRSSQDAQKISSWYSAPCEHRHRDPKSS